MKSLISVFVLGWITTLPVKGSEPVMRSSVSPEFVDGLHAKYMTYLADQAGMQLHIDPMPFARRLVALKAGELDVIVGMQIDSRTEHEVIYLRPSYEKLRHTFFVLAQNHTKLTTFDDLLNLNIGVTIHARYFEQFNQQHDLAMVPVSTLQQKIQLLKNGRIDTFIHFQESTEPTLEKMGLRDEVKVASYQPTETNDYYFTLSQHSPLLIHRERFEAIIEAGLANGDFAKIRQTHYAND